MHYGINIYLLTDNVFFPLLHVFSASLPVYLQVDIFY